MQFFRKKIKGTKLLIPKNLLNLTSGLVIEFQDFFMHSISTSACCHFWTSNVICQYDISMSKSIFLAAAKRLGPKWAQRADR